MASSLAALRNESKYLSFNELKCLAEPGSRWRPLCARIEVGPYGRPEGLHS